MRCPRCGHRHLHWLHDESGTSGTSGTSGSDSVVISIYVCMQCHLMSGFDKQDRLRRDG